MQEIQFPIKLIPKTHAKKYSNIKKQFFSAFISWDTLYTIHYFTGEEKKSCTIWKESILDLNTSFLPNDKLEVLGKSFNCQIWFYFVLGPRPWAHLCAWRSFPAMVGKVAPGIKWGFLSRTPGLLILNLNVFRSEKWMWKHYLCTRLL